MLPDVVVCGGQGTHIACSLSGSSPMGHRLQLGVVAFL